MFGYVTIYKPELKVKDYEKYKAYYCGLCRTLKDKYGFSGQMTLTYDMTFAIILLSSLYEIEANRTEHRCKVHPVKKQIMLQNEITEYAASMNMVLAYYHLVDDWKDDKSLSGFAGAKMLKRKVKKVILKYPRQCRAIKASLKHLSDLEKAEEKHIDAVAGCFGELMAELFIYRQDQWENELRRFGFFLGKFIYIMDAYDDLKKDVENGSYNPLASYYRDKSYEENCMQMLTMMIGECSNAFERLPCLQDADILRNILYSGVWMKYNKIQNGLIEEKNRKEQKNGK